MSRSLSRRAWGVFLLLAAVVFGTGVAEAQSQAPYIYRYTGNPLETKAGTDVGPQNFITVELRLPVPIAVFDFATGAPLFWSMSDGMRTVTSETPGNWRVFDNFQIGPDGLPMVWRCQASLSDEFGAALFVLHTNSAWPPWWTPWDSSQVGSSYGQSVSQGSWVQVDYSISATPSSQTVRAGEAASYQVTVVKSAGFSDPVNLGCEGVPPAATCAITPTSDGTYIANVDTRPGVKGTPRGTYTLTLTGIAGDVPRSTTVTLVVDSSAPSPSDRILGSWTGTLSAPSGDLALTLQLGPLGANPFDPQNPLSRRATGYMSLSGAGTAKPSPGSPAVATFIDRGGGRYAVYIAGRTPDAGGAAVPVELFGTLTLGGPAPSDDALQGEWRSPTGTGAWSAGHRDLVRIEPPALVDYSLIGTWLVSLKPDAAPPPETFCAEIRQLDSARTASSWWPHESEFVLPLYGPIIGDRLDIWGTGTDYGTAFPWSVTATTDGNSLTGSFASGGPSPQQGTWTATRAACKSARGTVRTVSFLDGRYAADFWIWAAVRGQRPTSGTVTGPQAEGGLTLNTSGQTVLWLERPPVVGEEYTFTLAYEDGTVEVVTDAIRPTHVGFPTLLSPHEGQVVNTPTPTFEWTPPSCGCQGYYRVWVTQYPSGQTMWSTYPNADATSVTYNSDGRGVPLTKGAYDVRLVAFDGATTGRTDNHTMVIHHFAVE